MSRRPRLWPPACRKCRGIAAEKYTAPAGRLVPNGVHFCGRCWETIGQRLLMLEERELDTACLAVAGDVETLYACLIGLRSVAGIRRRIIRAIAMRVPQVSAAEVAAFVGCDPSTVKSALAEG